MVCWKQIHVRHNVISIVSYIGGISVIIMKKKKNIYENKDLHLFL